MLVTADEKGFYSMAPTDVGGQLHGHVFCAGPRGSVLGSFIRLTT